MISIHRRKVKERKNDMYIVFAELSEKNKNIMILVARGMKAAQESTKKLYSQPKLTV